MRPARRSRLVVALALAGALALVTGATSGTFGAFSGTTANPANAFSSAPDWTAPTAAAAVVGKSAGGTPGFVRQGGTYHVYANGVADTGNPASGANTVTADVSTVTTGQTAAALTTAGGPHTVGGTSFTYRSALLTASNPLAEGTKAFTLALTDAAGNLRTQPGYSVVVDNTAPTTPAAVLGKSEGGPAGAVRQGGTYHVYANGADAGASASGPASATANVSTVTTGQTAVALTYGTYSAEGVAYNLRSALLTANNPLAAGTKSFTVTTTDNAGNPGAAAPFAAVADNTAPPAPAAGSAVVAKSQGGATGLVRQGGTYHVYANSPTDAGTPASGVGAMTADASTVTTGQTAVDLVAGTYTAGGVAYAWRSALLTASDPLAAGTKNLTVRATDEAGNVGPTRAFTVDVENTAPSASDVQANTGGNRQLGAADRVTYTFSETMDAASIGTPWTGLTTLNVVVRVSAADVLTVYDSTNTTLLNLGSVALGKDYVAADTTFGAAGTASTLQATAGNVVVVTLGTPSGATAVTANTTGTLTWTPSASLFDPAGNPTSTTPRAETGTADVDF